MMTLVSRAFVGLVFLATLGTGVTAQAADARTGCDSCSIAIQSLDEPKQLAGRWLFTRTDSPQNAAIDLDTSDTAQWRLASTPGSWKQVYDDKQNYTVGWYRGAFDFAPSLVGQEVVVLVYAFIFPVNVYLDGQEIFARPSHTSTERYFAGQAIPLRFKVTKPHHVFAMRVESPVMGGILTVPFELRRYDPNDLTLVFDQVWGGEFPLVIGCIIAAFGLFFLLIYGKTRSSLYLVAGLASLWAFLFFAMTPDFMFSLVAPDKLLYIRNFGLAAVFFSFLFSQFFYKFTPRINWIAGVVMGGLALTIASMAIHPNIDLFQRIRTPYFLCLLISGLGSLYMLINGVRARKPGAIVLLVGAIIFVAAGINDMLLGLGLLRVSSKLTIGFVASLVTMLYVASQAFANTFVENKRLVGELTGMNENLENLVAERTLALRQKTNDIQSMLQNMPQGVLTLTHGNTIHPEYSAYLETIFETGDIAGRNVMDVVFQRTSLGDDALSSVAVAAASCIGEDKMNFEFNSHLLPIEFEIRMADGRRKSLELSWSPIAHDDDVVEKLMVCVRDVTELRRLAIEASAQKRELEMIGEVLAVSQEKFQNFMRDAIAFVDENRRLIEAAERPDAELISQLFRNMHTVKGNARTYGLAHLTDTVHRTEQAYSDLRTEAPGEWKPTILLAQLASVRELLDTYANINDNTLGRKGPGRRGDVEHFLMVDKDHIARSLALVRSVDASDMATMREALNQVAQTLSLIGTEKVDELLSGLIEALPSLAKELGKEAPQVTIVDHGIVVRTQIAGLLKNVFTHMLRNSMDHGLETAQERQAVGKTPAGHIQLELSVADGRLRFKLWDDGRGLALAKIRQSAIERGVLGESEVMTPEALAQLIFASGFSTAEAVTEVSGRGVGMDAVKGFLAREAGDVQVCFVGEESATGYRPFELLIDLPTKFAVAPRAAA